MTKATVKESHITNMMAAKQTKGVQFKQYVRKMHILEILYSNGGMTIPEISKKSHVSTPTTSKLMDELISDGLVQERGQGQGSSGGGPRPKLYGLNPDSRYILGIDIGRKTTQMGLINIKNELVTEIRSLNIKVSDDPEIVSRICKCAGDLIRHSGIADSRLVGVGIGLPGLVDSDTGRSFTFFNFDDQPIQQVFEKCLQKPVVVENDARVMTLGESRFGMARGIQNALCLNIGWGVGMGMILNGRLYRGGSGFSGEFGHIRIVPDGLLCHCGKRGCLETVASGTALAELARKGIESGTLSQLSSMVDGNLDRLEAGAVVQAANDGDQYAIRILAEIGNYLGEGLAVLIHLLNPDMIVLGGRVSKAGRYILDPINQSLNQYTIAQIHQHTRIVVSELQDRAGVMGAAALVLEKVFDESRFSSIPIF